MTEGKRLFLLCFFAYCCAYFCRVNIAVVFPLIRDTFGSAGLSVGILGTGFFWSYALGQLFNGFLGDRLRPERMVLAGLILTAAANGIFGLGIDPRAMTIAWLCNGFFQSMFWGPLLRMLSSGINQENIHRVSVGMMLSTVLGYMVAWGMAGILSSAFGWRAAMIVPALIALGYAAVWFAFFGPGGAARSAAAPAAPIAAPTVAPTAVPPAAPTALPPAMPPAAPIPSFLQVVRDGRLWWPGIAAFFQGVVKDGIGLWIPTLLFLRYDLSLTGTVGYVLLIPLFNLAGVLIAGHLGKTWKVGEGMVTVFLFALAAAVLAFLAFASSLSVMLAAFLIGCASGLSYGTNYILLSLIPLKCAKTRRSSSVAGSLDFCSYFGAGAASIFIGMTDIRRYSSSIFLLWFFAALAGMAAMLIHARLGSRPHNPRPDRPAPRA